MTPNEIMHADRGQLIEEVLRLQLANASLQDEYISLYRTRNRTALLLWLLIVVMAWRSWVIAL